MWYFLPKMMHVSILDTTMVQINLAPWTAWSVGWKGLLMLTWNKKNERVDRRTDAQEYQQRNELRSQGNSLTHLSHSFILLLFNMLNVPPFLRRDWWTSDFLSFLLLSPGKPLPHFFSHSFLPGTLNFNVSTWSTKDFLHAVNVTFESIADCLTISNDDVEFASFITVSTRHEDSQPIG